MTKTRLAIFFIVLSNILNINAYSQVNDAGLWLGINLEKKVSSGCTLHLSDELRLNENVSEAGTHFTEIGAEYQFLKGLSGGVYYRFMQKRRLDDSYSKRHRFFGELSYRKKFRKISLTLRERLQSQYKDLYSSDKGFVPEYYLRSKLTLKSKILKATQGFAYTELFYQLSNPRGNEVDGLRFALGVEYNFKKFGAVEAYYLINKEINIKNPLTEFIAGLSYSYAF